jgi:hypothetical protein
MKLRFYNKDNRWYADIPDYIESGGTEEECEMVFGADTWLDFISKGKDNVFVKLSIDVVLSEKLSLIEKDEYGATYMAKKYKDEVIEHKLWICPVTLFLFGEYPNIIYYEVSN